MSTDQRKHAVALAAVALLILLASLLDRRLIAPFYDPALREFPLRQSWAFEVLGHTVLKWLGLGFWLFCLGGGGRLRRGMWTTISCPMTIAIPARKPNPECEMSRVRTSIRFAAHGPVVGVICSFASTCMRVARRRSAPAAAQVESRFSAATTSANT